MICLHPRGFVYCPRGKKNIHYPPSPPLPPPATLLLEITFLVVLEIGARNQAIGKGKEPFWHKDTNKLVRFLRLRLRFDILRVPCWYGGWAPYPTASLFLAYSGSWIFQNVFGRQSLQNPQGGRTEFIQNVIKECLLKGTTPPPPLPVRQSKRFLFYHHY